MDAEVRPARGMAGRSVIETACKGLGDDGDASEPEPITPKKLGALCRRKQPHPGADRGEGALHFWQNRVPRPFLRRPGARTAT